MASEIPESIDDLNVAWLTSVLREGGSIDPSTRAVSMAIESLGEGSGFSGSLARLSVSYRGGTGPGSLVVKLPTQVPDNRAGSELLGVYEREIMVYRTLLEALAVPTASMYHAAITPNPNAAKQIDNLAKADRLPIWVLRLLGRLILHSPAAKAHPSVLVLEDLAPATVGDQVLGCTSEQAKRVISCAAGLHAATWGSEAPASSHWLLLGDIAPKLFHAGFLDTRRALLKRGHSILGPHSLALIERLRRNGRQLIERVHSNAPRCLCHGDLRLDNIFFSADGTVRAFVDWQLTYLGPGVVDIAYFVTGSLPAETPERVVDDLISHYHDQLRANGVRGYSLDRLRADYDDALLVVLQRMAGIDNIDFGEGRGVDLIDIWIERLDSRLRRVAV